MHVAIVIYPGFTALDAVGPFEVLSRLPGAEVRFAAVEGGPVATDMPGGGIVAVPLAELATPDIVVVAGGSSTQSYLHDPELVGWLRRAHETSTWTTSVCTGALLLGAAGVLAGRRATTHWYELDSLAVFGATPVSERVVEDGRVITAAGISAGIDMALRLLDRLTGPEHTQWVELNLEYDPHPPYGCGSIATAPPDLAARARAIMASGYGPTWAERVAGAGPSATTSIDPVCDMDVDVAAARAAGLVSEHDGVEVAFCAPGCKRLFDRDPSRYRPILTADADEQD